MKSLFIEASACTPFLIYVENDEIREKRFFEDGETFSKQFWHHLNSLLKNHGLSLKEIDWIAYGTGPGSFTGTRICEVLVKTFAYVLDIPLKAFCSLECFVPKNYLGEFLITSQINQDTFYLLKGKANTASVEFQYPLEKLNLINFQKKSLNSCCPIFAFQANLLSKFPLFLETKMNIEPFVKKYFNIPLQHEKQTEFSYEA